MALRSSRQSIEVLSRSCPLQRSVEIAGNSPNDFSVQVGIPSTRLTQEDQDNVDEEKQRESMHTLVQTWLDGLQQISVITTFFVATEVTWLAIIIPSHDGSLSRIRQLAIICVGNALTAHSSAAIISFLAAFCLIRYKLTVAQKEEEKNKENLVDSPKPMSLNDPEMARGFQTTAPCADDLRPVRRLVRVNSSPSRDKVLWSTNPHLVQVGPFQGRPPTELLARCYFLSIVLFCVGFILTIVGGISFAWDRFPRSIGISTSISTVLCLATVISIVVVPSTQTSHIFLKSR